MQQKNSITQKFIHKKRGLVTTNQKKMKQKRQTNFKMLVCVREVFASRVFLDMQLSNYYQALHNQRLDSTYNVTECQQNPIL